MRADAPIDVGLELADDLARDVLDDGVVRARRERCKRSAVGVEERD